MTADVAMQLLGNYAFPVVMCLLLAWMFYDQNQKHADESKAMQEAINNMTLAIQELSHYIKESK